MRLQWSGFGVTPGWACECFSEQSIAKTQRHRQFQFESVWEIVRDTPKFQALTMGKKAGSSGSNGLLPVQSSDSSPINVNGGVRGGIHLNESNGQVILRASQAGSQPSAHKKKRKIATTRSGSEADDSEAEFENLRQRLSLVDKASGEANAIARETLAFEREKFVAENEARLREAERLDRELALKVRAAEREELVVDLDIIKTNDALFEDADSKEAIRLLKAEVLQKHQRRLS